MSGNAQNPLLETLRSASVSPSVGSETVLAEIRQKPLSISGSSNRFTEYLSTWGDFIKSFVETHCILDEETYKSEVPVSLFSFVCFEYIKSQLNSLDPRDFRVKGRNSFATPMISFCVLQLFPTVKRRIRSKKQLTMLQGITFKPDSQFVLDLLAKPLSPKVRNSVTFWLQMIEHDEAMVRAEQQRKSQQEFLAENAQPA